MLIKNGYNKYILREAMKGILNEKVRTDRCKKGFNASINSVIDLKNEDTLHYIFDKRATIFNILDRKKILAMLDFNEIPNSLGKFLFNFINCRIFLG